MNRYRLPERSPQPRSSGGRRDICIVVCRRENSNSIVLYCIVTVVYCSVVYCYCYCVCKSCSWLSDYSFSRE